MPRTNPIGDRGENAAERCFVRPIDMHYGFETSFLGDKAQLLDFRVALLDSAGQVFGPHFYVQVKTHQVRRGKAFPTRFSAEQVRRAKAGLTPTYLVGVELDGDTKENVWICGIGSQTVLPSIPKLHDLKERSTLIQLYGEVLTHFQAAAYSFAPSLV